MDIKTWYQVKYAYGTDYGRGLPLTADEYCNALCEYLNTELDSLPLLTIDNLNTLIKGSDGVIVDENEQGNALEIHLDQNVLNKANNAVQKTDATYKVYATDSLGYEKTISYDSVAVSDTLVLRNANATVNVGYAENDTEAVNIACLNDKLSGYLPIDETTSRLPLVYGKNADGTQHKYPICHWTLAESLMLRDTNSNCEISTRPNGDSSLYVANTEFVSNALSGLDKGSTLYIHHITNPELPFDNFTIVTNFSDVFAKVIDGWIYPSDGIILSINALDKASHNSFNASFNGNIYGSIDTLYYISGGDNATISKLSLTTYSVTDIVTKL